MTDSEKALREIRELIGRSSLGSPTVRALRARTPPDVVEAILIRTEIAFARGVLTGMAHRSIHHNKKPEIGRRMNSDGQIDEEFRQQVDAPGDTAASAASASEHPDPGDGAETRTHRGRGEDTSLAGRYFAQTNQPVAVQPARPVTKGTIMSDDLKQRGPADRTRVNVHEPWEVAYWTKALGCTEAELRDCASRSVMVEDVRRCLEQKKRR